ncbi:MAG: malectin domain-containing carbohydrate-binding protein [Candidatus Limivivens sp.]|nr:malectin domain-containing carbohydrate-binding protein [Candidatus Limivivens sp.]
MEYRESMTINEGWESILASSDMEKFETVLRRDQWKKVELPHNWEQYEGYHRVSHGNLHGTAWYRKELNYREAWRDRQVFLLFEGVGSYADVWLNGRYVGGHKGGRTCFSLDITEALSPEGSNVLYVRAAHPEKIRDLPWICGGCYGTPNSEGSQPLGIFRPVHIQVTGKVRVKPFGVCITTPGLEGTRSAVKIETELVSMSGRSQEILLRQELLDPEDRVLEKTEQTVSVGTQEICVSQTLPEIRDLALWYPDDPVLYRMRTSVWKGRERLDQVENSFGFRTVEWENFDSGEERRIDPEKIRETPCEENQNFVTYLRGSAGSAVAIVPGGVGVYLDACSPEEARISIETVIRNQDQREHRVQLESFVQTFNRTKSIANLVTQISIKPGETVTVTQKCDPLIFPDLWSEENPYLHNVISTVRGVDEVLKEYCQTSTSFGIRECAGLANKGDAFVSALPNGEKGKRRLLINGKHCFLNGSCEYEHELGNDHAFTGEMIHTRMEMFRAAGFNAFREAHCPHNLRYLEYCDRHGILYWAQMGAHIYFDTEEFRGSFLGLTREWVRERRNSPSLILWSLQNESMLPSEFSGKATELIRSLDVTSPAQRKVVTCNGGTGSDWNIPQNWSGTYGGNVENYGQEAVQMRMIGEYGQYRVKGKHQEGDVSGCQNSGGDVSEELFAYCLETKVREAEKVREAFYGHFQWIFVTHANPGRELLYCLDGQGTNGVGVVNSKGIFTSWGEPTDAYYMYRSNYISPEEAPFLYLVSHSWPDRFREPATADFTVYSNCEEVEIYNDYGTVPLGRTSREGKGTHFTFRQIPVKQGVMTVKGYVRGSCAAEDRIFFPALPLPEDPRQLVRDFCLHGSGQDLYRVNCGGEDYVDAGGFVWSGDRKYREDRTEDSGNWGWCSWGMDYENVEDEIGSFARIQDEIENTEEQGLFQTFRYGRNRLEYRFPAENGEYLLELYFAEPWYGNAGENAAGWRCFDVAVNGSTVLSKLDIWKEAGGSCRALRRKLSVSAEGGMIRLTFPKLYSNQAVIQAIRITREKGGRDTRK